MPGYEPPVKTATLVFEDGDLKGLELKARLNIPLGLLFRLSRVVEYTPGDDEDGAAEDVEKMMLTFAEQCLLGWNLERGGKPVPCTPENFLGTFDVVSATIMLSRYVGSVGALGAPLRRRRNATRTSGARQVKKRRSS